MTFFSHRHHLHVTPLRLVCPGSLSIQPQKITLSLGCHPLDVVTRGGPPRPPPLVTPLQIAVTNSALT